eukprot:UN08565
MDSQNKYCMLTAYDMFGVVSNECNNIGKCPWGGLIDCYGIGGSNGKVWQGTSHEFREDKAYTTRINNGEIVEMGLDCKLSTNWFK